MKLNFKEKYLVILVAICFIIVGFYYSYAIFVTKQLQENVVAFEVDNDIVSLTINNNGNSVIIKANSNENIKINLNNKVNSNYNYLVLFEGIIPGVKVSSSDSVNGIINDLENKTIEVSIVNTTDKDVQLDFIVKISNNDLIDNDIGYSYINNTPNFDHSKANKPEINNMKLIPVSYVKTSDTDGFWKKTDINNKDDLWYSYENGYWANAVLLNDTNYNKYKNSPIGTEIELGDILGFYVWIPRFKYYIINNNNYTNYERITNVVFENGNNATGTIICNDQISNQDDKHVYSEVCTDNYYGHIYDNLSTYTHPSFKDKNGFWVSKFLIGENEKILPNTKYLKKDIIEANTISNKLNTHILTNMEYGAIILLSNSMYGKTGNSLYSDKDSTVYTRIYANTYINELTGCSSEYNMHSKSFITSANNKCIEYNDLTDYSHISNSVNYPIGYVGAGASSTGTIYGVYDLASKSGELVSAFVLDENGNIDIKLNYSDYYSYNEYIGKVSSSSNIYNLYRYKLGDAIKEHFRSFGDNSMWHSGILLQNVNSGILVRGNDYSPYSTIVNDINFIAPFRLVLN